MQILRLLAARRIRRIRRRHRAVSTITATAPCTPRGVAYGEGEDEGPFFDLDLSCCCSAPASTAGTESSSCSESEDSFCAAAAHHAPSAGDLDFVISLQRRSRSASPSYDERLFFCGVARGPPPPPPPPPLMFCASEPSYAASSRRYSSASRRGSGAPLRALSFGSAKAALYGYGGGRASFSRSSSSARLFAASYGSSPDREDRDGGAQACRLPSGDVFRRYLSKISSRLRLRRVGAVGPTDNRLRKSRSASAALMAASTAQSPRRDDTFLEKQDGIASAIAHCKESFQRASISECDTSFLRSRSDPAVAGAVATSS